MKHCILKEHAKWVYNMYNERETPQERKRERRMEKVINKTERFEMLKAMELIARSVNDEEVFDLWLNCGIADGDVEDDTTIEDLEYYMDDETYADIMDTFLLLMKRAYKNGGLYSDRVVSKSTFD